MLALGATDGDALAQLLARYGLILRRVADGDCIPGSYWGASEAGLTGDNVLMGSDNPPQFKTKAQGFHVCLSFDEPAEAERVYNALSPGGTQTMPIQETFWALRFAMFVDKFGTPWMINCERPT